MRECFDEKRKKNVRHTVVVLFARIYRVISNEKIEFLFSIFAKQKSTDLICSIFKVFLYFFWISILLKSKKKEKCIHREIINQRSSLFLFFYFRIDKKPRREMSSEAMFQRGLQSCLCSFVPCILSIPFIFVYYVNRFSFLTSFSFILLIFVAHFLIVRRFFLFEVLIRSHFLTLLLTIGVIWSLTSLQIGLFTIILSIFHLSEYISVALWNRRRLDLKSFLLNHSPQYNGAIVLAYSEYFIERLFFFPNGVSYQYLWTIIGLILVIIGEYLRKLAMFTARQHFSHIIQDKPDSEHRLIMTGIYSYVRHPSYVGWFWWACGTQILLTNPVCFFIYLIVRENHLFEEKIEIYFCSGKLAVFCRSNYL